MSVVQRPAGHPVRTAILIELLIVAVAALAVIALVVGARSPATSGTVPGPAPTGALPTHASRHGVRVPLAPLAGWPTGVSR